MVSDGNLHPYTAVNPRDPTRRVLQSTCGAYELLYWDCNEVRRCKLDPVA